MKTKCGHCGSETESVCAVCGAILPDGHQVSAGRQRWKNVTPAQRSEMLKRGWITRRRGAVRDDCRACGHTQLEGEAHYPNCPVARITDHSGQPEEI
jgi:hypothetical protein